MLRRLSVLAFLVALVTCGSRTQTPDEAPYDPYSQSGGSPGSGGTATVTGGTTSQAGSTAPGNMCGSITCPANSVCCPNCGICVSPDLPCPDCSGGAGGFFGTGGSGFPGTGGFAGFFSGTGGAFTGTGGAFTGTGGFGGCAPTPPPVCITAFQDMCPQNDLCTCATCGCQVQACMGNPGCLPIYRCMAQTGCTDPRSCYAQCNAVINASGAQNFPFAMNVLQCSLSTGCPRCARPVPIPPPIVDAGLICSTPPPPNGPVTCTGSGQTGGGACTQTCYDPINKYVAQCANGVCTCNYDGRDTCRCSYAIQSGCYSCCPPWAPLAL